MTKLQKVGDATVVDISAELLKDDYEIGVALNKNIPTMISQWDITKIHPVTKFGKFRIFLANLVNSPKIGFASFNNFEINDNNYESIYFYNKLSKWIHPITKTVRLEVVPVMHLSVSFYEDQIKEASEALLADLRKLHSKGMIRGHLAMPSMVKIMSATSKNRYSIYCMVHAIDDEGNTPKQTVEGKSREIDNSEYKTLALEGKIGLELADPAFNTIFPSEVLEGVIGRTPNEIIASTERQEMWQAKYKAKEEEDKYFNEVMLPLMAKKYGKDGQVISKGE